MTATERAVLGRPLPPDAAAEDVVVGMRQIGAETLLGPADGTTRMGVVLGLVSAAVPCRGAQLVALDWAEQSAATPEDRVHLVSTVVRHGPEGRDAARLVTDLRLVDAAGVEVQRGRARWRVPSVNLAGQDDRARVAFELGSVAWGRRIGERLAGNAAFRSTTTPFDGAIGFSCGTDEVNFRVYRGSIVEVARKAVDGPTFTIDAPELTWLELLTVPTNDYFRRTMTGSFKVRGNGFQYVRMIKAVMLILDEARAEVAEVLHA
ncbi:hypothetical protein [Dactylosporangium sp. CA-092794]|uniref:hypothetical protein n=1 Tax=Dactylosporangium sp. CA-092794 TaxID=3239929 RepID=UPI003D8DA3F9